MAAVVAIGGHGDTEDVRSSGYEDVEDVLDCGEDPRMSCATKAESVAESQRYIGVLEEVMTSLKEVGAQAYVAHVQHEIRTEKRRARAFSREDPDVMRAMVQLRDQENAAERKRRYMLQDGSKTGGRQQQHSMKKRRLPHHF